MENAAIFESNGYSIDINAVKDQLRILGHDVSDDVIVDFIKQVYLPQRTSQNDADAPRSTAGASIDDSGIARASHATTARTHSSSTSDNLALADAVEYDDNVVVAHDEDVRHARPSSFPNRPSKPSAPHSPPIDVRGDSASDWNDDFGLKSLKLSTSAHDIGAQQALPAAAQAAQTAHGAQAPSSPEGSYSTRHGAPIQAAHKPPSMPQQSRTAAHIADSDTSPTRDSYIPTQRPAQPPHRDQHPAQATFQPRTSLLQGLQPSPYASLPHAPRTSLLDRPPLTTDSQQPSHDTYSFSLPTQSATARPITNDTTNPYHVTDKLPPTRNASHLAPDLLPPVHNTSQRDTQPRPPPRATLTLPHIPAAHPHSYLADVLPDQRLYTPTLNPLEHPPSTRATVPPPARAAVRATARQLLAANGLALEGSEASFSTRSLASTRASSSSTASGGKKKVDRVNRYHQLAAGWEQDRFLKRNESRPKQSINFHTYFASLHASEEHHQQQRKQAALERTRKALAPAASFKVPTEKRRDSLRWEVRMQMLRQASDVDA